MRFAFDSDLEPALPWSPAVAINPHEFGSLEAKQLLSRGVTDANAWGARAVCATPLPTAHRRRAPGMMHGNAPLAVGQESCPSLVGSVRQWRHTLTFSDQAPVRGRGHFPSPPPPFPLRLWPSTLPVRPSLAQRPETLGLALDEPREPRGMTLWGGAPGDIDWSEPALGSCSGRWVLCDMNSSSFLPGEARNYLWTAADGGAVAWQRGSPSRCMRACYLLSSPGSRVKEEGRGCCGVCQGTRRRNPWEQSLLAFEVDVPTW